MALTTMPATAHLHLPPAVRPTSAPTKYEEDGVEVLEWQRCDVTKGSTFDVTFTGIITKTPDVEPDWSVSSYGRLDGKNDEGSLYSQQVINTIDYRAPTLVLTMTGTPSVTSKRATSFHLKWSLRIKVKRLLMTFS